MTPRIVTVPELFMIAGTRVALGVGAGLLLADRLSKEQRQAVGWTLFGVGVISTIPLASEVLFGHGHEMHQHEFRGKFPEAAFQH